MPVAVDGRLGFLVFSEALEAARAGFRGGRGGAVGPGSGVNGIKALVECRFCNVGEGGPPPSALDVPVTILGVVTGPGLVAGLLLAMVVCGTQTKEISQFKSRTVSGPVSQEPWMVGRGQTQSKTRKTGASDFGAWCSRHRLNLNDRYPDAHAAAKPLPNICRNCHVHTGAQI